MRALHPGTIKSITINNIKLKIQIPICCPLKVIGHIPKCKQHHSKEKFQLYINRLILNFGVFSNGSWRNSQRAIWLYDGNFAFNANTLASITS